jgi:hypothetical protein
VQNPTSSVGALQWWRARSALLPVMVDRRLQATKMTLEMLEKVAAKYELG